ncbi:MAG: four-carbon acid sugar kinase family protein [Burkholderiaceae bacterium]
MTHAKFLIVADDLSGAADCALGFVKAGMPATVLLHQEPGPIADGAATPILAIDADTRNMQPAAAAQAQGAILQRHLTPGQPLYKKIDSTLRGNVAAELAPFIALAGTALVAPAFPQAGRTTRGGYQFVHGVRLDNTTIWRNAIRKQSTHIPTMLAAGGIVSTALSLETIRQPLDPLRQPLHAGIAGGVQAIVCDAESDTDLQRIVQASTEIARPSFWVGSAGLSDQLAQARGAPDARPAQLEIGEVDGSIVTVVGSFADVSRRQLAHLRSSRPVIDMAITADFLCRNVLHASWRGCQEHLLDVVQNRSDVLLRIEEAKPAVSDTGPYLCQALAELLAPCAAAIGALVLTGGETARAVLSRLDVWALLPMCQIVSGVPLSRSCGKVAIPVVTKAGAFGSDVALVRCYDTLCQARRPADRG